MERKWFKIGAGAAISVTTIVGLFYFLVAQYGFVITDKTGNITCEGTYEQPCVSEFVVRNPTRYNVDIYTKNQTKLEFSPDIRDYALFYKDNRCTATGNCRCELKNGQKIGFAGWRCVDFTNKTKPRADTTYVFRFAAYSQTTFLLAGIKEDPKDTIKWTFGTPNAELDPFWYGSTLITGNAQYTIASNITGLINFPFILQGSCPISANMTNSLGTTYNISFSCSGSNVQLNLTNASLGNNILRVLF